MADNTTQQRLENYGQWLLKNADKKGTPDFNQVAEAYKALRNSPEGIVTGAPEQPKDTSLGTALQAGDLGASIGSRQYLNDVFDGEGAVESTLGKAQDAFNTHIYNPLAKLVGAEERTESSLDRAKRLQAEQQTSIDADRKKLADLNYAPKIGSYKDIGGIGDALQYGAERAASSAGPMLASIASGGTLTLPQMAGETNEALRNIEGLDPETRLAIATGAGGLMAVAENLGIGAVLKGLPKGALERMGAKQLGEFLASKGVAPAVIRTMVAATGEGVTEGVQEGIQAGAEAVAGGDPGDVIGRIAEATAGGAAAGATFRGAPEAAGAAARLAKATAQAPGKIKAAADYNNDPRQVESDLRVYQMYQKQKADLSAAKNGTDPAPAPVFATMKDTIKRQIQSSITQLYKSNQIDADAFASLIKDHDSLYNSASKHNRDITQSAYDRIAQLQLDPRVAEGLTNAFRDLNTITEASFDKNSTGPIERAAKAIAPIAAAAGGGAGFAYGGPAGVAGGLVASGLIRKGARGLDSILKLREPEILRRGAARQSLLDKMGKNPGSTTQFLSDLEANAQAGAQLTTDQRAARLAKAKEIGRENRKRDIVPLGGYHNSIYQKTGLRPTEVDKGLLILTQDGSIDPDDLKNALGAPELLMQGNRGNHIMAALNQLKLDGKLKADPKWTDPNNNPTAPSTSDPFAGMSYPLRENMRNLMAAADNAVNTAPTPAMKGVVADVRNARTRPEKRDVLAQAVAQYPEHADWLNSAVAPLTNFGPRENAQASEAAPAPAPIVAPGGGLGSMSTRVGTIPGAPARMPMLAPNIGDGSAPRVSPSKPGDIQVSQQSRKDAASYREKLGIDKPAFPGKQNIDEDYLKRVADWMEQAKHEPENPEVKEAYKALAKETIEQFKAISKDVTVTPYEGEGEPYRNSAEMSKDVVENKHLYYFRTENGFGETSVDAQHNPLLAPTKYKDAKGRPLLVNDLFRIVHDYYAHTQNPLGFGPVGEYNAFQEHARMFSTKAIPALAAETLAQNAWVNFGPHLRDENGNIPKKGEPGFRGQKERPFSDQKNTLVPWELLRADKNPESIAQVMGLSTQVDPKGDRISTRNPGTKGALEDPTKSDLQVDVAAMKRSPKAFEHNTKVLKTYPGFKTKATKPEAIARDFVNHVKDNLLWLFDQVPEETRERSRLWYDGANRIAGELAAEYALPERAAAGVLAALSPQKDWYQNVSLAERVLEIAHTKTDIMPDDKMKAAVPEAFMHKYGRILGTVLSKPYKHQPDAIHKAMWLRLYDEGHNPRTYNIITPEGGKGAESTSDVAWGSLVEISKAINVIENSSRESISELMGDKHKVRSFYNNIAAPKADAGDVTIDTHAVAAGLLRPLAGSHAEVHHNFGSSPLKKKQPKGWVAAKNVGEAGAVGLYGLYAEAYRKAAAERGVLPREMQSITWEAVRGLFDPIFKRNKKATAEVDAIWKQYQNGQLSLDEAREKIKARAGGIDEPSWKSGRDTGPDEE